MNSRFKFIQSVNPQAIPTTAVKPKFSKLMLATSKIVAIESVNEKKDHKAQAPHTVTCVRTTTTAMMTNVLDEAASAEEVDLEDISCAQQQQQQQKILLYESTRDDTQSALLTDDDTDSVNSSLDSKDSKEITDPKQDTVANVDQIDTQMQSLSFISTLDGRNAADAKRDDGVQNISRQFDQLDIINDPDAVNEQADDEQATQRRESIVSLSSSDDTVDRESDQLENTQEKNDNDSVIVLSDSDTEEAEATKKSSSPPPPPSVPTRNISQEPPLKPIMPSSNDPAMYNISPIDSSSMQRVNNFFDKAPFVEPVEPTEAVENSFNSSHMSKSQKEDIFVPETTDEESATENSINDASFHAETNQTEKEKTESNQQQLQTNANADVDEARESNEAEFSDNNIIVDIPVKKSTSDQPRQLIRSQSGVCLTASRSSPITKTSTGKIDSDGTKRSTNNVILKKPGNCGITVNSSNGQLNIAAKININIQIVEDSSEESSEDNKPIRKSPPIIQLSEDCPSNRNTNTNTNVNSNDINSESPKSTRSSHSQNDSKNNRTPSKNSRLDAVNKTPKTPRTPKTPQTASKLKQFEFVPPKSMTKAKNPDSNNPPVNDKGAKPLNKSMTSESSENDGFQVDKNIPISPRDQKLLHKVYGDAWKTPDVIRSYSAVKGKNPDDRSVTKTAPPKLNNRYSKGFDLFKRKRGTNLNSTTLDDHAEISIIETPKRVNELKSSQKGMKPPQNTPQTSYKTALDEKNRCNEPSPSVLFKKRHSPKLNKQNLVKPKTPKTAANISPAKSSVSRPQRSVQRKRIIYSDDDESDKENSASDWTDSSYACSDSDLEQLLTDDDSDKDKDSVGEPKSTRGKKAPTGENTTKRRNKKSNKNELIYLDLSSEEIAQVDENFHSNVPEDDLANITQKFLEANLNADEKPKKKTGRKLFTQKYDDDVDVDETNFESEPRSVTKKKPVEEDDLNVEIPTLPHKLFDSKNFGSPKSVAKTPNVKHDIKIDEFKTPIISRILAERKTPFNSAKSKLDSPPKMFATYGFLKSLDVQASMMLCHPDAKKFRENFKSHKEELTTILYKLFNEKVFDNKLNVDIIWNKKLISTAGRFHGQKRVIKLTGKNHRVELSEKVLTSADRLRCTLIHELCHAATWIFHGEGGHGTCWKSYARKANRIFPELPIISRCHNYDIQYKYTYKCDMCHHKSQSHSKSKKVENIRCSFCHGGISIFLNKKTKDGKIVMEPVREAKGFAKFVKEKYKEFKRPGVKHADVMRQISSQYSTLSQEEKEKY